MTSTVTVDKTLRVKAPARDVWAYVTDWGRHSEWIPLSRTEAVGGEAHAVGGKLRAWSGVGPIGFWDPMTVTRWEEQPDGSGFFAVVHTGRLVKGDAEVTVTGEGNDESSLRWVEHFQLGRAGSLGWRIGGRLLDWALERALARLGANVEAGGD